LVELEH